MENTCPRAQFPYTACSMLQCVVHRMHPTLLADIPQMMYDMREVGNSKVALVTSFLRFQPDRTIGRLAASLTRPVGIFMQGD